MEDRIRSVLEHYIEMKDITGGSVLLYKDGREVLRVDEGLADVGGNIPYSTDTIIRLFSMSKPITSAASMILIERGLLDRLDPVSDYIPSFKHSRYYDEKGNKLPVSKPVTIGDLLDMTSGLSYPDKTTYAGVDADIVFSEINDRLNTDDEMDTQEVADALGRCTLAFDPGTDYLYGTGADVLGAVIEKAAGMKLSDFMEKEIFAPLGMSDTAFYVPEDKQSRLARSYVPASHLSSPSEGELPFTTDDIPEYLGDNLGIKNRMDSPNAFESGGAGLASTLTDYMRFAQMLLNGDSTPSGEQILTPATVDFMTSGELFPKGKRTFNERFDLLGFTYSNLLRIATEPEKCDTLAVSGEFGWDGWLGPYFAAFPKKNAALLIALQRTDSGTYSLTRRIRNVILSLL